MHEWENSKAETTPSEYGAILIHTWEAFGVKIRLFVK